MKLIREMKTKPFFDHKLGYFVQDVIDPSKKGYNVLKTIKVRAKKRGRRK